MRCSKITIKNILGIESLEIEPGAVTQIFGENGAGKTSVLDAIRCALSGGTDATLLKAGAEKGEVVIVLDDGTTINRRITAESSDVTVVHREFGKISKPAQYLKKLADALSLNPIQFLTAPKKDRVDQLLAAIPMQVTADQLGFVPQVALAGINLDKHALEVIGSIQKAIYDLRTGVNRSEKDKRATIREMSETLPADAPEGNWSDVLKQTTEELGQMSSKVRQNVQAINKESAGFKDEAKAHCDQQKDLILANLSQAIENLRSLSRIEISKCESERDSELEKIEGTKAKLLALEESDYRPKEAELKEKIGQAKAMVEQHAKAETTRQHIAQWTKDADALEAESAKLTSSMSKLEVLKASLLEKLPVPGLEIKDGDLYVGGIAFDRVNESKRIRLAIEIAKLRSGQLGLVAVDGLERLDAKTFDAFKKEAAKSKLQFVISRVSDGPLAISTEGQLA
jgi:ABC-type cobalamin/Fe3+-siderophores transport system ATPase subunit/Asp-tRNA(Asn)/Glu-tRNA(Gln) amidotransferase C subunit